MKPGLPATTHIDIRGQNDVMNTAFTDLGEGLILAVVLVYALLVVLFQSWVDPLIIMMAVPGALIGILWMLALDRHQHQCGIADGRDHVGGHLGVELHPGGELRQRHQGARRICRRWRR